ncbi:MAG: iron ABC transporter permease [Anaerolineae bacterium]|nr:iron ABC transporter permease [Anaerolineae bacterium]
MDRSCVEVKRKSAYQTLFILLLWAPPLAFVAIFFFYPLAAVLRVAGEAAFVSSTHSFMWRDVLRPLGFTVWQAALSTALTLLIGLPGAYVFARYTFAGKTMLRILTTLPFILPTVVVAAAFNALLGPRGWVNLLLMGIFKLETPPLTLVNTLGAILLAHIFYNTTIVLRLVGGAWSQLDERLERAARSLGASSWRAFWEVTLPLLRPAILSATLLVFLFDFTSFGVILLLGGARYTTLEVEIYIQTMHMLNLPLAGLLSSVQLFCTLALMLLYSRVHGSQTVELMPRTRGEGERKPSTWRQRLLVGGTIALLFVLLISPLAALVARSFVRLEAARGERSEVRRGLTLVYYRELFINRRASLFYVPPVEAARNSLVYASLTTGISLGLGCAAAYALTRRLRLNRWLDSVLMLPLGASAVTLGLGFILVFNRPPLDVRTFPLLLPFAHSLVALPFVVRTLQPALVSIPEVLRQAAAVLGASPWRVWCEVELPIIGRALLVAAVFAFTISMGEFGATSFLARPEYPTLPVAIYRYLSQPGALNYGQALAMATLLMAVCGAGILVMEKSSAQ